MPRGALNREGSQNQDPRPLAQTAPDTGGVHGLLSFTCWAATPAAQALRGGSTQRAGRSVLRLAHKLALLLLNATGRPINALP
jgi:hypothetical protein